MMKSSLSEQIVLRERSAGLVHVMGEFLGPMIRIRTGPAAAACHRMCSVKMRCLKTRLRQMKEVE